MEKTLSLDLETYSDIDLVKCGVYAYVDSPNFEILLVAYCFDEDEVKIIDLASGEVMPEEVKEAVLSDDVIKTAFNANFERICLSKYFNSNLKSDSWCCTAAQASMLALPPSLEGVSEVLGLNNKKMKEGKELIKYFCCPCKPTNVNGNRIRNLPVHDLEKWNIFKNY
ncbi:DNA polymerase bacteriophage-type [Clostridium neonatale]|nr:DNA polymerase bacteriophage-type [Clostridium neonatale]CAI3555732.1 DNA polymerase bacteriophage-type [Clostridium neonatale]CAI3563711.1 DNA polymerase bacteriophage-type [Clostridium neonatale]CAI3629755.1 DNA polymerase bacteriophage-type [Clostridium neonatale]CAI3658119.1 DNA polymerase bacteriophage-type [Clostridium neonatale]